MLRLQNLSIWKFWMMFIAQLHYYYAIKIHSLNVIYLFATFYIINNFALSGLEGEG